ncbi:MAG: DUF3109 family protein [Bacteroidota bacterium]
MIAIENTLISEDLIDKKFCCDLSICKGECCIEGDAGAPMEQDEIDFLEEHIDIIRPYLTAEGLEEISKYGVFEVFVDGSYVTPLIENKDCVYSYMQDGIVFCGIEKAFLEKKISFRKPISCYLYPVRIQKYENYTAVNYHEWDICKSACTNGKEQNTPLYVFLKKPLIAYFGKEWYKALREFAQQRDLQNL